MRDESPTPTSPTDHGAGSSSDLGTDFVPEVNRDTHIPGTGLDGLIRLLDLEQIDDNIFRGQRAQVSQRRIFGGQVAAQALVAAGRTVEPERVLHSLHSYFLRPGDPEIPIAFVVERVRDGRSFTTRRSLAMQHGEAIFALSASFQLPEEGLEHQSTMPDVPGPTDLPGIHSWEDEFPGLGKLLSRFTVPFEVRYVDDPPWAQRAKGPRTEVGHRVWLRADGRLPDDRLLHACAATFASDLTLLDSVLVRHGKSVGLDPLSVTSLDHAMWFHRPFRADEWFLYSSASPSASASRGLAVGQMFGADGVQVATVVQEGLLRIPST